MIAAARFSFGKIADEVFVGGCSNPNQRKQEEQCGEQQEQSFKSARHASSLVLINTSVPPPEAGF